MKRVSLMLLVLLVGGVSVGADLFNVTGFFSAPPEWRMLDYSSETLRLRNRAFRVVGMVLEQSTGEVLIAFEEFDTTTGIATGRTSFHHRHDTNLGRCKDPVVGIPSPCTSGMVIP